MLREQIYSYKINIKNNSLDIIHPLSVPRLSDLNLCVTININIKTPFIKTITLCYILALTNPIY